MSEFGFVPVRFVVQERLLLRGAGPTIAPTTLSVINGSVLRGVLAERCGGNAALLEQMIISGQVAAAPGFPVLDNGGPQAFPAPRMLAVIPEPGQEVGPVVDSRDSHGDTAIASVPALLAYSGARWTPAQMRTTTATRSTRPRAGGSQDGLGPIAFTTLDPHHVFEARFRVSGTPQHRYELRELLADLLDSARRGGEPVVFGSGADGSYGGTALTVVGELSEEPDPWTPRDVEAGATVDLVLRSPALVADPDTGHDDPTALAEHVRMLLTEREFAAEVIGSSVTGTRVGGAHTGYGRMRPAQWAAAAGSVVTLRCTEPVERRQWTALLAHRVGERTVDGLGILAMVPPTARSILTAGRTSLPQSRPGCTRLPFGPPARALSFAEVSAARDQLPPASSTNPATTDTSTASDGREAAVAEADDMAARQLDFVQRALFSEVTQRWVSDTAIDLVTRMGEPATTLGLSLLSRLRTALTTPANLRALLADLTRTAGEHTPPPGVRQLEACRIGEMTLLAWLSTVAGQASGTPATSTVTDADPGDPVDGREGDPAPAAVRGPRSRKAWAAVNAREGRRTPAEQWEIELGKASLWASGREDAAVTDWIAEQGDAVLFDLARAIVLTLHRTRPRSPRESGDDA